MDYKTRAEAKITEADQNKVYDVARDDSRRYLPTQLGQCRSEIR